MNCRSIQKSIPSFLDGAMSSADLEGFQSHLRDCPACPKKLKVYQNSWDFLKGWKDVEPAPGYVGNFFEQLSQRSRERKNILPIFQLQLLIKKLAPPFVVGGIILAVLLFGKWEFFPGRVEEKLANLPPQEMEFLEQLDLAQHLDAIDNIELLEDMDVIENLDQTDAS